MVFCFLKDIFLYHLIQIQMSFSPKQFREALQQSGKITQKFEKYLNECKQNNIETMYFMFEEFLKIISDKQSIILKVNSIFALTFCIRTCEYITLEMIQAFLLPTLQEVALYQSDKRTYAKTSQYFRDKGYPASTPNIEQLSHNYVTMVTNLVFWGAAIKENYYFFTDKLNIPSAFKQISIKLVHKNVQIPGEIQDQTSELQQTYQNNLFQFQNYEQTYVDFFKRKLSKYLLEGGKGRQLLDVRKLLKNNDSWLTSEIIGSLNDALLDDNFQVRRHSLGLLNQLFIWGDVEAIMVLNEGQAVEQVSQRILEVKGSSDLGRGTQIYPEIKGQIQQKKNFYIDFLRCLQTWSKLVPTAIYLNRQDESLIHRLYSTFKDRNFIFPANEIHSKYAKEFEENMKKNEQRNKYIINQLNDGDTSKNKSMTSNRFSKYSQKISLIKQMRQSTILSISQIEKLIQEAEQILKYLTKNQRDLAKNMKTLNYFLQQFEKKFGLIQESVTQSKLENYYQRGCKCNDKIAQIGPLYSDYINGKLDFKKFGQLYQLKLSNLDYSRSKSKFSDILSKLSKSKNSFSRDGLELSKSLHAAKAKEQIYAKQDFILERSNDEKQFSATHNFQNNKIVNNPSNLSQNSSKNSKRGVIGEPKQEKASNMKPKYESNNSKMSNNSKKSASSFQQQQSIKSDENQLRPTAKFLLQSSPKIDTPNFQSKKDLNNSNSSYAKHSSNKSSKIYEKNQSNQINLQQIESKQRKVQQFSDNSSEQQSSEEKEGTKKQNISQKNKIDITKNQGKNKILQSKSRQIFSDNSFSQYNESNQQIRQEIDKSQNPNFNLLFKNKTSVNNNSGSKLSKLPSQQHYNAVLESLIPKSNHNQTQSKLSRDKSNSQLPPKSNFDTTSKFDKKNYQINQENSRESHKPSKIIDNYDNQKSKSIVSQHQSQKSYPKQQFLKPEGKSNISDYYESNSLYPPPANQQKRSNISKLSHNSSQNSSQQSQHQKYPQDRRGTISNVSSSSSQRKTERISHMKSQDRFKRIKNNGENYHQEKPQQFYRDSKIRVLKQQKLQQIQLLQKRIKQLKNEQKSLYAIRQWQSPARPSGLRTALSPRFRNNNTTKQTTNQNRQNHTIQSSSLNSEYIDYIPQKRKLQQKRKQQMNFDLVDLFKPPEGRLIYSKLYSKQLSQLDIRQKRKILKGKDLVFRNQDIEVGMMIHKDPKDFKIIYYITANKYIKTFLFKVQSSSKIEVHPIPNQISFLEPKKQYRIYFFAEVLEFPYKMPIIRFKYYPQLLQIEEKLFIKNEVNYFTSIVPFYFMKFITFHPITPKFMEENWSTSNLLRGQETAYSKKLLPKHFYILQYFPDLCNLQSRQYQSSYGVECSYGSTKFLLKVVLKINKFMYIQGMLTAFRDRVNSEKIMEYAICCMNQVLSKTNKDYINL